MERRVFEAAQEGDVATLKRLLQEDPLILDRTVANIYSETPLHVAAMLGYVDFTNEILRKKPKLSKELNSRQSSPLHLAAAMGNVEVVKALLLVDGEMCRARDRDGLTPIHLAAVKGRVDVLEELIGSVSSNGLADLMGMDDEKLGKNVLHMCVKQNQLGALKILVEMMGKRGGIFVNYKDAFGNTVLHLAVADKQIETVKYLLLHTAIQVNAQNLNGLTAMDTLLQTKNDVKEMEIGELLRQKGASKNINHTNKKSQKKKNRRKIKNPNNNNNKQHWVQKTRDALFVVASLLATMAFQAVISPPGGVLQETKVISESEIQNDIYSIFPYKGDSLISTNIVAPAPSSDANKKIGTIGKSVMSYYMPLVYDVFLVANTMSFLASLSIILLLISGLPLSHKFFMYIMMIIMWVAITGIGLSYFLCINMTIAEGMNIGYYLYLIGACLFAGLAVILALGHTIQMMVKLIKWLSRVLRRKSRMNSNSMVMDYYDEGSHEV